MSNPRGEFHPEIVPEGWFDQTAQAAGWFDKDNLDAAAVSGAPYTLPVGTSAVTLTGSTIALRRALKLSVSTAAVTATGSSVALRTARKLAVSTAAVTATGSTVALKATRTLAVSTAAVTLTGSSITLTYASPNKSLAVDTAAVTLTGSEIGLTYTAATGTQSGAGAYGTSPAISKQRERRRRRILEQLRRGEQPPIERLQEALETTVASAGAEPEASAEMLTMAKGYLSAAPQNNSAQIILALATLAELEAALQAASLMKQSQLIREEEEMLAFLLLTA